MTLPLRIRSRIDRALQVFDRFEAENSDTFGKMSTAQLDRAAKKASDTCNGIIKRFLSENLAKSGVESHTGSLRERVSKATLRAKFDTAKGRVRLFYVMPAMSVGSGKSVKPASVYKREIALSYGFVKASKEVGSKSRKLLKNRYKKTFERNAGEEGSLQTQNATIVRPRPYLQLEQSQIATIGSTFISAFKKAIAQEK
jgi:hypothetical protein